MRPLVSPKSWRSFKETFCGNTNDGIKWEVVTCLIRWPWRFDMRYRLCGGKWSHTSTAHIYVDRGPQTSHYPMGMGHEEEFNDNITFRFGNGIGLVYRSTSRLPWLWELPSRGKTYWHLRFRITIQELDIDNSRTYIQNLMAYFTNEASQSRNSTLENGM